MSFPPRYYSSKFDEIKIDLIGAATRNARQRADQFADNSGVKVGSLASASQGVFQVTPVHSTEISGYGRYDTSTIEKSVKAVVTITYSVSRELEGWIR
ncbi:MAG: SIMPL domain-containing protein [Deltaproteobacteria bacterium]|nr:SIMPL domain-containing protein [Deltaproteobacteria bacterium]